MIIRPFRATLLRQRRAVSILCGLAAAVSAAALAMAAPAALRAEPVPHADGSIHAEAQPGASKTHRVFDIIREGDKIGSDTIDVDHQNDATTVKTATLISVKVMFVEAYRYEHASNETWKNGQLVAFKSHTNDNGTKHTVELTPGPTPDKAVLIVDGKKNDVPKTIAPASLWNKDVVKRTEIFDSADGKRLMIKAQDLGEENVTLHGVKHQTHHYKITARAPGEFDRDLWYDGDALVRMKLLGSDHSTIISDLR